MEEYWGKLDGFGTKDELIMIELFNQKTSDKYEFVKNCNKCGIDVRILKKINNKKFEIGKIELELKPEWFGRLHPRNWTEISFLKRKLFVFDDYNFDDKRIKESKNMWKESKKDNDKTIYLIYNVPKSVWVCQTCDYIIKNGKECYRSCTSGTNKYIYEHSYWRLDLDDKKLIKGIDNCIKFIIK